MDDGAAARRPAASAGSSRASRRCTTCRSPCPRRSSTTRTPTPRPPSSRCSARRPRATSPTTSTPLTASGWAARRRARHAAARRDPAAARLHPPRRHQRDPARRHRPRAGDALMTDRPEQHRLDELAAPTTPDPDLVDVLTELFADYRATRATPTAVVDLDRGLWQRLEELGLTRLTGSEAAGGSGGGWVDAAALLGLAAAAAAPVPLAEHDLLGGWLLEAAACPTTVACGPYAVRTRPGSPSTSRGPGTRAASWRSGRTGTSGGWPTCRSSAWPSSERRNLAGEPSDTVEFDLDDLEAGTVVAARDRRAVPPARRPGAVRAGRRRDGAGRRGGPRPTCASASSSAGRSGASRRCSTSWPTSPRRPRWPGRPPTPPSPAPPPRTGATPGCSSRSGWPSRASGTPRRSSSGARTRCSARSARRSSTSCTP